MRLTSQCVILVGGLGTRLGALTKSTPKPLLDVGGAPFLETLFAEGRRRDFDHFLLLAGYRSETLVAFLAEREIEKRFACRVELSIEPEPLGTGGALVHALSRLHDDFLLLNGDTWFDFNWLDLVVSARREGASGALALRAIDRPDRYDTVALDGSRIVAIHPRSRVVDSALINGGVSYFTRRAVEGLTAPSSLEADLMPRLIERGALRGYPYSGFFIDIGVPETLSAAADLVPRQRRRPAAFLSLDALVGAGASDAKQTRWIEGAKQAVKLLNDAGYYVFVVADDARAPEEEGGAERLRDSMACELAALGASIDDWGFAARGAPIPDLLAHWPVERDGSFFIGNEAAHIHAAEASGVAAPRFADGNLAEFLHSRSLARA